MSPSRPEQEQEKALTHMDSLAQPVGAATAWQAPASPHSPLPWRVAGANEPSNTRTHGIECGDGWTIADVNDDGFEYGANDSGRALVNAEFIVRACNNFDALLTALKAMVGAEQAFVADTGLDTVDGVTDAVLLALAAIAKAEG